MIILTYRLRVECSGMATVNHSLPISFNRPFQRPNLGIQFKLQLPTISILGSRKNPRFRFGNVVSLRTQRRLHEVFASNTDPPGAGEKDEEIGASTAQGPPFLTILAGFLVFFLLCWIVGSVVLWLVGLIVSVSSPS